MLSVCIIDLSTHLSGADIRSQSRDSGRATVGACSLAVTYLQRQCLQPGIFSMTISSSPCSAVSRIPRILPSGNPLSPPGRVPAAGSLWRVTQQGKRPVHCETYYSLSYSASAPLPAAQWLLHSGWQACGHREWTLPCQEPSSKGSAES